jgi:hypothetical protein
MTLRRSLTNQSRQFYSGHSNEHFVRVIGPHILTEGEVIRTGPIGMSKGKKNKKIWIREASSSGYQQHLAPLSEGWKMSSGKKVGSFAEKLERENL